MMVTCLSSVPAGKEARLRALESRMKYLERTFFSLYFKCIVNFRLTLMKTVQMKDKFT